MSEHTPNWRLSRIVAIGLLLGLCVFGVGTTTAEEHQQDGASQNTTVEDIYGSEVSGEFREVSAVEPTSEGGLMALVVSNAGSFETTIVRLDRDDNVVNEETVPGRYVSLARVDNDSYAAAGLRGDNVALTRIHEEGWTQWTEQYGGEGRDIATDVVSAPHGDAYVLATTESFETNNSDMWLLRVDDEGAVRWDRVVTDETWTAFPEGERLPDGSLVAATRTKRSIDKEVDGKQNVSVARLVPDGEVQWRTTVSGSGKEELFDVVPAHGDGVVLAGASNTDSETFNFWAARLSETGEIRWVERYDSANRSFASSVVRTSDGYLLAGGTNDDNGAQKLVGIDRSGTEQFRGAADRSRQSNDMIQDIAWTTDGRLVAVGSSTNESQRSARAWMTDISRELDGVDPGPSTWESQHSKAEKAGEGPTVEDSSTDLLLFGFTAASVLLLVAPFGLRRLRGRQ